MNIKISIPIIITLIITTCSIIVIPTNFYLIGCLLTTTYFIFEYKDRRQDIKLNNLEYVASVIAIAILIFSNFNIKLGLIPILSLIVVRIIFTNIKGKDNAELNSITINASNKIYCDLNYNKNEIIDLSECELVNVGQSVMPLEKLIENNNYKLLFDKKVSEETKLLRIIDKRINRILCDISDVYKYIKNIDNENCEKLEKIKSEIKDIQDELEYMEADRIKLLAKKISEISTIKNLDDKKLEIKSCAFNLINTSSEIKILYINSENIMQSIEYIKSNIYGQDVNVSSENKAYLEFVKEIVERLDNTMVILSEEIKDNNRLNKLSLENYEGFIKQTNKNINTLIDSFSSNIEKINERLVDSPESILEALKYFDVNISRNIDKAINAMHINIDKLSNINAKNDLKDILEDYFEENSILDKRLEIIERFVNGINVSNKEIESISYFKNKLSDKGYEYISLAEYLYSLLGEGNNGISDYSPVYIMYSKFLEYELSSIISINTDKNTTLNHLLVHMSKIPSWYGFVEDFKKRNIRQLRNKAAHGSSIEITLNNVIDIRKFLFYKNSYSQLSWIEFIAEKSKK